MSEFYVCNKNDGEHSGWMDGCMVWWRAEGHGYTYDLNLAGIFTETDQAKHYPDPNTPELPVCPNLAPLIAEANTVHEIVNVCKSHGASCSLCGVVEIRQPQRKEPANIQKEAA